MTSQARRDDTSACIYWLADDPFRYRRAMKTHRPGSDDLCVDRCGRWPCLTFQLADAARALHEARVQVAERLSEYPTTPMRAVTARHPLRVPREASR